MLDVLTINIGAASRDRADALLQWLAARPDDVVLLTETSAGPGTTYILDQFRRAGFAVVNTPDDGDRGAALVSRVRVLEEHLTSFSKISIPARVATAVLDTRPRISVAGVYIPSRDRSLTKTERKQTFISTLLECLHSMPADERDHLILGGDYNVISRTHHPRHPGFLPFELDLLETLQEQGLADVHAHLHPDQQEYSWIGRTGDGYRYDYFNVGSALTERITTSGYLHETRRQRLTDHAAVKLSMRIQPNRLNTTAPTSAAEQDSLF